MPTQPVFRLLAAFGALVCVGLGLADAAARAWTCDDAFISFRYAENLVAGDGLVFNVGERVEGYTNFSWTMLIALAMRLGVDPVPFTQAAGLLCFGLTLAVLLVASRRVSGAETWMPIAAMGLALNQHVQLFATCGLETPLFMLLATLLLLLTAWGRSALAHAAAGAVGTLAAMTRPDGLLLCAIAGLYAVVRALRGRIPASWVLAMALPGLVVYVPYFVWKWSYYGYPLPNTFYAKTAHDPFVSQGLLYLRLFFGCYWALALALGLVIVAGLGRRTAKSTLVQEPDALPQLTLAFVFGYLAFVAWVGGDFMFGRFVIPVVPALYLGFELVRRRWPGLVPALVLAGVAIAGTVLRQFPTELHERGEISGIVEERTYYPADEVAHKRRCAERVRVLLAGHESRIAIGGAQAMLAYYGKFDLAIECSTGLTDEYLAHLPLPERTRIGHEKSAALDPDYLVRRRVQFMLDTRAPDPPHESPRHIDFGDFWGRIVTWDREVMAALRGQPNVQFVDCEAFLEQTMPRLPAMPLEEVEKLWHELEPYYFRHAGDPVRENAFRTRLGLPQRDG